MVMTLILNINKDAFQCREKMTKLEKIIIFVMNATKISEIID